MTPKASSHIWSRTSSPSDARLGRTLTVDQSRAIDRYASEQLGIPGMVLMENAGRNAADLIERWLSARCRRHRREPGPVAIVCGKGNNGGDGFVVARHLAIRGHAVTIDLAADPSDLAGDAALNHAIVCNMGLPIRPLTGGRSLVSAARRWSGADVLVDALLGTGFSGEARQPLAGIIAGINALDGPLIVAIDVPSGLDAETGKPGGVAVRAHRTITMVAAKRGYRERSARAYLGRVHVVDIGAPADLIVRRPR